MKAPKKIFVCSECDAQTPKWLGRCPECGAWNSLIEETYAAPAACTASHSLTRVAEHAAPLTDTEDADCIRTVTGIGELDRVLGGGLVDGSVVLLAGEPGIGKSTLLMQLCGALGADGKILYVSGEESRPQLKIRAKRLGTSGEGILLLTETDLDTILTEYERVKPDILIVDSIQTIYSQRATSAPGSITQVRECAAALMQRAKADGVSVIIVGHVNKEGGIAGPKVLEHMVDAVLYFEGDRSQSYRIIRAAKNRYGSTNEIGVFEMTDKGLREVDNPSVMLLSGRPTNVSGTCVTCTIEGSRPILAETQGLATQSGYGNARRMATGYDYNRLSMLLAVLEKRAGYYFSNNDAYINIVGGLRVDEPAIDLSIAMALISSLKDTPVDENAVVFGEIGLAGEIRSVSQDLITEINRPC